jgi:putative restriction endonuclease
MGLKLHEYLEAFKKLRLDRSHGIAPHKPILLLSVLQLVKKGNIVTNRIYITPELISTFKLTWSQLVVTNHICKLALPFFHMKNEGFWKLIPKEGQDETIRHASSVSSINALSIMVDYALMSDDLFRLMQFPETNFELTRTLLDKYFQLTQKEYSEEGYLKHFYETEDKILNENAEDYRRETARLIAEGNDEEVFFRGGLFKKEVPKIYNNTCCISGYRVDALVNISMIDACHIRPFSESHDDTITNGVSLCPNLHRAFDRGLISIDKNYKVLLSSLFKENVHPFSMRQFEGIEILLPKNRNYWPDKANLEWHNKKIFKK